MKDRTESGFVAITTLFMLTLLMGLGAAVLMLATQNLRQAEFYQQRQQAFYAAESGLAMAVACLQEEQPASVPEALQVLAPLQSSAALGAAEYEVRVVETHNSVLRLQSTGRTGDEGPDVTLELRIRSQDGGSATLFRQALCELTGDDLVGVDWPEVRLPDEQDLDDLPSDNTVNRLVLDGLYLHGKDKTYTISADRPTEVYITGDLRIPASSTLMVSGDHQVDIYVYGGASISGSIVLDAGFDSWLVVYVRDELRMSGNGSVGAAADGDNAARTVVLMDTGELHTRDVQLDGNNEVFVGIYAPTRRVKYLGSAGLQGAVVAGEYRDKNEIIWDDHLLNFQMTGTGESGWTVVAGTWQEI